MANPDFLKQIVGEVSRLMSTDLTKAAQEIIDNFYKDYDPSVYDRTFGINPSPLSSVKTAGTVITIEQHTDEVKDAVDNTMWLNGIRGLPATGKNGWENPNYMEFIAREESQFNYMADSPHALMNMIIYDMAGAKGRWESANKAKVDAIIQKQEQKIIQHYFG